MVFTTHGLCRKVIHSDVLFYLQDIEAFSKDQASVMPAFT